jgi:hypothetical protein
MITEAQTNHFLLALILLSLLCLLHLLLGSSDFLQQILLVWPSIGDTISDFLLVVVVHNNSLLQLSLVLLRALDNSELILKRLTLGLPLLCDHFSRYLQK